MSLKERNDAHEAFRTNKITTIVSTIAYGMGIDKPDIRYVIHFGGQPLTQFLVVLTDML
jgi:superfamily II DNA helicase RecQ